MGKLTAVAKIIPGASIKHVFVFLCVLLKGIVMR